MNDPDVDESANGNEAGQLPNRLPPRPIRPLRLHGTAQKPRLAHWQIGPMAFTVGTRAELRYLRAASATNGIVGFGPTAVLETLVAIQFPIQSLSIETQDLSGKGLVATGGLENSKDVASLDLLHWQELGWIITVDENRAPSVVTDSFRKIFNGNLFESR